MSLSRTFSSLALTAALGLSLAACGGAGSEDGADHGADHTASERTTGSVEGAPELSVAAVDIDFEPATLELTAGEPLNVTVHNDGETLHDFTLDAADVHLNVEPGESKTTSLTIDEPGTYEAKCTVPGHAEAGMTIDVVVS